MLQVSLRVVDVIDHPPTILSLLGVVGADGGRLPPLQTDQQSPSPSLACFRVYTRPADGKWFNLNRVWTAPPVRVLILRG